MTFSLTIKCDNAAGRRPELARILRKVAHQVETNDDDFRLVFDTNGKAVGDWRML